VNGVQPWWTTGLVWIVGAGFAYFAMRALDRAGDARLAGALALASGCVVASEFARGIGLLGLTLAWCVCTVLDAAVVTETRSRRVPVVFAAVVALLVAGADVHGGDWISLAAGGGIFACFAVAWARSKGRASGLGDALIAGLAGFALGVQLGTIVVAVSCFAAAGIALARKRRGVVAFAPYLAATFQVALLLPYR
jgi:prepilin signal peptidase PulO-like enzyme (type II secretory pathway)